MPAFKPVAATRDASLRVRRHRIRQPSDSSSRLANRFTTRPPNHTAAARPDGALHLQRRPRWRPLKTVEADRKRRSRQRRVPRMAMVWPSAEGNGGDGSSGSHCNRMRPLRSFARTGACAAVVVHLPGPRLAGPVLFRQSTYRDRVRSRAEGAGVSLFVGQLPRLTERYRSCQARLRRTPECSQRPTCRDQCQGGAQ